MVIKTWQIGLEIQQDTVRAVAVQRQRQGWQLRHWWQFPLPEETLRDGVVQSPAALLKVLATWRKELPLRHQLRVALPTQRTLQRPVPAPDTRLREPDREAYLVAATAKQLQMLPAQLSWDYATPLAEPTKLLVTAARQSDVKDLLNCLAALKLFPATLTPGASVLPVLGNLCHPHMPRYLVHREADHWLWASTNKQPAWGWLDARQGLSFSDLCQQLNTTREDVAFSCVLQTLSPQGVKPLDAWRALARLQPPLPKNAGCFTVAIALAIGRLSR